MTMMKKRKRLRHGHLDHCSYLVKKKKRFVDPYSQQKLADSDEKVEGKRKTIDLELLLELHLADEFELKLH